MRILLTLALMLAMIGGSAQTKSQFNNLSGKAKAKAAAQEEIEADKDAEFQRLMTVAQDHFESREYEAALEHFAAAGERRPLNVYPPVMIEDVRLAMKRKEVETAAKTTAPETPSVTEEDPRELSQEERVAQAYAKEMEKVNASTPSTPEPPRTIAEEPKAEIMRNGEGLIMVDETGVPLKKETETEVIREVKTKKVEVIDAAPDVVVEKEKEAAPAVVSDKSRIYPNGWTEETFKEGNKVITQRTKMSDGVITHYRKVTHGWGGVFYFKDGESITLRTWQDETEQ